MCALGHDLSMVVGVLEVLSWRLWCSGVSGDGWADVVTFRAGSDI